MYSVLLLSVLIPSNLITSYILEELLACYSFPEEHPNPYDVSTSVEDEQLMGEPATKKQRLGNFVTKQEFNQVQQECEQLRQSLDAQSELIKEIQKQLKEVQKDQHETNHEV